MVGGGGRGTGVLSECCGVAVENNIVVVVLDRRIFHCLSLDIFLFLLFFFPSFTGNVFSRGCCGNGASRGVSKSYSR